MGEGFRTFDHTGDLGLEVWCEAPERLHGLAAEALAAQLVVPLGTAPDVHVTLVLEGDDPGDLMIHWLNTVLLQCDVEGAVWTRVVIQRLEPRAIGAVLHGERIDRARHVRLREVKAVSHHELVLDLTPGACRLRVILDI
jgi:SHS2 domain-containing protein